PHGRRPEQAMPSRGLVVRSDLPPQQSSRSPVHVRHPESAVGPACWLWPAARQLPGIVVFPGRYRRWYAARSPWRRGTARHTGSLVVARTTWIASSFCLPSRPESLGIVVPDDSQFLLGGLGCRRQVGRRVDLPPCVLL